MSDATSTVQKLAERDYEWGFVTDIDSESFPPGLDEQVVRALSAKKQEPQWMLEWRLKALAHWQQMKEPDWAFVEYEPIDYQQISYYSAPKSEEGPAEEPRRGRSGAAGDLREAGHPAQGAGGARRRRQRRRRRRLRQRLGRDDLPREARRAGHHLLLVLRGGAGAPRAGQEVPGQRRADTDNFFAALNSAVFSDGSFVYIPKGVRCPMELSTYFRINAANTGQFERTLIVAEEGSYVSYLEGCTAPMRDENQLHAAVVELVALDDAQIKYSTVQNWYPGDENGKGGIYNFVTKRGKCAARNSKISWTQVETGSAITWKYPSCILRGDNSVGEFYSVAVTNGRQQADTGTKMIHIGKNTRARSSRRASRPARPEHLPRPGQGQQGRRRTPATTRSATRC